MKAGINVEGTKAETIAEIKNAFIEILHCDRDEATIQTALEQFPIALKSLPPITISNNLVTTGKARKNPGNIIEMQ